MSQMLKSSGAMSAATLASRILGLVREQVYARFMGTSAVAGAFTMAFTVPNLFRRLLGEGALTAAERTMGKDHINVSRICSDLAACYLEVDEPTKAIFGGIVSAPAFAQIAAFDLQYLEVPPDLHVH